MPSSSRGSKRDSPDPLLLTDGDEIVAHRQPSTPVKKRTRTSRLGATGSPAKQTSTQASPTPRKAGVASAKKSVLVANGSPTLSARKTRTPAKTDVRSPVKSTSKPTTLASSAKKHLPTPRRSISQSDSRASPLPRPNGRNTDVEPAYELDSPSKSNSISRDAFLANEALKRQREARNFKYKGDANAPRLTRSGKVVGEPAQDEYDVFDKEESMEPVDDNPFLTNGVVEKTLAVEEEVPPIRGPTVSSSKAETVPPPSLKPLADHARSRIQEILSILTSTRIADNPPPFHDELSNDSLLGITKLLQGTVDRGEGNSALVTGPRGSGKTRTMARALNLLASNAQKSPIVVKLSGHVQTNDRLAIREMGRQIALAEGSKPVEDDSNEDEAAGDGEGEEYAPTTLPSHLLALLTAPSPRAIIIVIEEFDLFTEHARQALLYCLLDVVQSVKTGPVETTGRGIAVIGLTSRIDTLLLLEKRVKSRFSHRMWRVTSPIAPGALGWRNLLRQALVPWASEKPSKSEGKEERKWKGDWEYAVDTLLGHSKVGESLDRLTGLTTDVRNLYRPFIVPITEVLNARTDFVTIPRIMENLLLQIELAGWGMASDKLRGLPHPAMGILIIAKHLHYAGREEFNFAQVEEEYLRFSRTKLVGIGKTRWPVGILRTAFDLLLRVSLLISCSNANAKPRYAKVRCSLSPHEIVAWFRGEGGNVLGPELTSWGRVMGGHA